MFRFSYLMLALLLALAGAARAADDGQPSPVEPNLPETSRLCVQCHDSLYATFMDNTHARLRPFEFRGTAGGCESCHGLAAKHADSGETGDIIVFSGLDPAKSNAVCLKCHQTGDFLGWGHGRHSQNGLACTDCHFIHKGKGKPSTDQFAMCGKCHNDVRAKMYYPSHHPVREGKMNCTSCHNPHGRDAVGDLRAADQKNDLCLKCHTRYQGPFVYEHAPVLEDCTTCHNPHGTAANNLLKQNEPYLCLQCHSAHFHAARKGDSGSVQIHPGQSDNPWGESGWIRAYGTKCTQCHSQVHGSDLPSQSLPSRGKFLTR